MNAVTSTDEYEILDGVRRAKAALMCGHSAISARVDRQGLLSGVIHVELERLRSPHKRVIDISTQHLLERWLAVLQATRQGISLPPILICRGCRGVQIDYVGFKH